MKIQCLIPTKFLQVLFIFLILVSFAFSSAPGAVAEPGSRDFYARLGLDRNASIEDIKLAYRKLNRKFHPDLNPNVDRADFQNIKQAYEVLTGKAQSGDLNPLDETAESVKAPKLDREKALTELFAFYARNESDKAEELRVLLQIFRMGKYDIEYLMGRPQFSHVVLSIFSSSLWGDSSNKLFETFVEGWGLYSLKTAADLLALLVEQMDPRDPRIEKVFYAFDFKSLGFDFQNQTGRKNWLLRVNGLLLKSEKYLGTPAGEYLLQQNYAMWQLMKAGEPLSPYPRDLWAVEILSLLDIAAYANHAKVIEMVREIPALLEKNVLGAGGVFSERNAKEKYRAALKNHAAVFSGALVPSPIDDLVWFYSELRAEERDAVTELELKVLTRLFSLRKYAFEAMMRDPEFSPLIKTVFQRKIWRDPKSGLLGLFVNQWGFYQLRYSSELVASLLGPFDPSDSRVRRLIYEVDFGNSPGTDFTKREKRLDFLRPILSELLLQENYLDSLAGQELTRYLGRLWRDVRSQRGLLTYAEGLWILSLLKTTESEVLQTNPILVKIYQEIFQLLDSGQVRFNFGHEKAAYALYKAQYQAKQQAQLQGKVRTTDGKLVVTSKVEFCRGLFVP